LGTILFQRRGNGFKICCSEQLNPVGWCAQTVGTQSYLLRRFFAGNVERLRFCREKSEDLQEQSRFANARVPAQKDQGTTDKTAAQDPVEFGKTAGEAGLTVGDDLAKIDYVCFARQSGMRCAVITEPAGAP